MRPKRNENTKGLRILDDERDDGFSRNFSKSDVTHVKWMRIDATCRDEVVTIQLMSTIHALSFAPQSHRESSRDLEDWLSYFVIPRTKPQSREFECYGHTTHKFNSNTRMVSRSGGESEIRFKESLLPMYMRETKCHALFVALGMYPSKNAHFWYEIEKRKSSVQKLIGQFTRI